MDTEIKVATAAENNPVYDPWLSVNEAIGINNKDSQR